MSEWGGPRQRALVQGPQQFLQITKYVRERVLGRWCGRPSGSSGVGSGGFRLGLRVPSPKKSSGRGAGSLFGHGRASGPVFGRGRASGPWGEQASDDQTDDQFDDQIGFCLKTNRFLFYNMDIYFFCATRFVNGAQTLWSSTRRILVIGAQKFWSMTSKNLVTATQNFGHRCTTFWSSVRQDFGHRCATFFDIGANSFDYRLEFLVCRVRITRLEFLVCRVRIDAARSAKNVHSHALRD